MSLGTKEEKVVCTNLFPYVNIGCILIGTLDGATVEIHNILDKISEQSSLFEEILLGFLET